jgi:hypothetical protein
VKYLSNAFQTKPSGYLDGSAELKIVPGFFSWTGRETYDQVVVNPFAPLTPDNLESINYVTTGPRFTLRPTLQTTLTVDGTYSLINTSSPSLQYVDIDNHRYASDVKVDHAFSNSSSLYLAGTWEQVGFTDQVLNTDFTRDQGSAGFRFQDGRTVLDLSGGCARLHAGATTPGAGTWRLELSRVISPTQRVSVLDIAERYKFDPASNRDVKDASALFARQLAPALNWEIGAEFEHQDFAAGSSSNTVNAISSLRWQLGRRNGLRFIYSHSAPTPRGYAENQVGVTASYALSEAAEAANEPIKQQGLPLGIRPISPMSTQSPLQ